nr:recombinase family protein [Xenorhabdus anantnagensis]
MLQQVRTGDTIIVHSIDRLCRNMMNICTLTLRLRQQGVTLIFLKEQLTFSLVLTKALPYKSCNCI